MYFIPYSVPYYSYPYYVNTQAMNNYMRYLNYHEDSAELLENRSKNLSSHHLTVKDYGPNPFVVNINEASKQNAAYRTALWTGQYLQVTLMSINPGDDIGLENHPNVDQFLRIEQGQGVLEMGRSKERLDFKRNVSDDFAIMVPARTWHNVTNTGKIPLKLYSIYAPPNHPHGTVHLTKADAITQGD